MENVEAENKRNFLPDQYKKTREYPVNHCYLREQFSDYSSIFKKIEGLIKNEDYTLGSEVDLFEERFAKLQQSKYAVGVGSGTDALFLSLKALGVGPGDEVITTPYTFFATIGAIATAGAKPVFVDIKEDYNIDPSLIEAAITEKTKAIMPVHWAGLPCDMNEICDIAKKHGLFVVEDSAHGICANLGGQAAGTFGEFGCFSMHPLKNLNVWGDGGMLVTQSKELYDKMCLLRNHGLKNRDECEVYGYNSRLDTLQAIVANHMLDKIEHITDSRIAHSKELDDLLADIPQIKIPPRDSNKKQVYHLYVVRCENREKLIPFLQERGVDVKVHYPIPMHLQPAAKDLGYKKGDFPLCEEVCDSVISLPVHEFIEDSQIEIIASAIKEFYGQ